MLTVDRLTFSFGNRRLFDALSFRVKAGEVLRIAGPNGAGKSTLMAILTGLLSGAAGKVTYDGDTYDGDNDFKRWTSWVAADANGLVATLSAYDNLQFWLNLKGAHYSEKALNDQLNRWGLGDQWTQRKLPVGKFSTGMKRRLALARLELEQSKLWMLDEPLFGLDRNACALFQESLHRQVKNHGAVVIITHDERILSDLNCKVVTIGAAP